MKRLAMFCFLCLIIANCNHKDINYKPYTNASFVNSDLLNIKNAFCNKELTINYLNNRIVGKDSEDNSQNTQRHIYYLDNSDTSFSIELLDFNDSIPNSVIIKFPYQKYEKDMIDKIFGTCIYELPRAKNSNPCTYHNFGCDTGTEIIAEVHFLHTIQKLSFHRK